MHTIAQYAATAKTMFAQDGSYHDRMPVVAEPDLVPCFATSSMPPPNNVLDSLLEIFAQIMALIHRPPTRSLFGQRWELHNDRVFPRRDRPAVPERRSSTGRHRIATKIEC